jgi:hypothetical protein
VGILTYKSLYARFCRSWAGGEKAPPSKRQKYQLDGLPSVYMAYVFEDWDLAGTAADALGTYGVDIYADWSTAQLFKFDADAALRLSLKLAAPDAWLVACLSERARETGALLSVLELARETMEKRRYAVLPVRYESPDWVPGPEFLAYPRIEQRGDDLVIVWPDSPYRLPLRRWLKMTG